MSYLCLEVYKWLLPRIRVVLQTTIAPRLIRSHVLYGTRKLIAALLTRLYLSGQLNLFCNCIVIQEPG